MINIFGIRNCDKVKKALRWFNTSEIKYEFHDIRESRPTPDALQKWVIQVGWESILNRRSTTWRGLVESDKSELSEEKVITLLHSHPTLIKRPVIVHENGIIVGFDNDLYQKEFLRLR